MWRDRYDEVQKKLQQVESDLERAEERAETGVLDILYCTKLLC